MEQREIIVKESVAESIAAIALYIEAKGMPVTALKFSNAVYDFIEKLATTKKSYHPCIEPIRKKLGFKCIVYKKKYTIVLIEYDNEIVICEFISSKLIKW
jgi:plasmid stabilization system protein ParE